MITGIPTAPRSNVGQKNPEESVGGNVFIVEIVRPDGFKLHAKSRSDQWPRAEGTGSGVLGPKPMVTFRILF